MRVAARVERDTVKKQLAVLTLALLAWSLRPGPTFAALTASYVLALVWIEVVGRLLSLERVHTAVLSAAFALAATLAVVRTPHLIAAEGLLAFEVPFRDRAALEMDPSVAPRVVFSSQPQTLYVQTAHGRAVRIQIGDDTSQATDALGSGLFRVDYRPHRPFGAPEVDVRIAVDGVMATRRMQAIDPVVRPAWMCRDAAGDAAAAVSEETDEIFLVDRSGVLTRIPTGDAPTDCAFAGGFLLVSHRYEPTMRLYRSGSGADAGAISLAYHQRHLVASARGDRVAVTVDGDRRGIFLIDVAHRSATFAATAWEPEWVLFGPDDETLLVTERTEPAVRRMAIGPNTLAEAGAALRLSRPAIAAATSADRRLLFLAVTDFREPGGEAPNHFVEDQVLQVDATTLTVIKSTPTFAEDGRRGGSPQQMQASGEELLIAFTGTGELGRLSGASGVLRLAPLPVAHPAGLASLGDGLIVVASPSEGRLVILREDLRVVADHVLTRNESAVAALRRAGEATFVESTRKGASCQSCHVHADSDDVRHDIGHGERRPTLSVRGIAGTAPYLRGASYPSLATLGAVTETIFGGYPTERPNRRAALAAYVESLPSVTNPRFFYRPPLDADRRGLAAFEKARCHLCHRPPAFTSLGQMRKPILFDVAEDEEAAMIDVPSLLGLRFSAPYLSNGRAATIASVLGDHNDRNTHGDEDALTDDERQALIAFLEGL